MSRISPFTRFSALFCAGLAPCALLSSAALADDGQGTLALPSTTISE